MVKILEFLQNADYFFLHFVTAVALTAVFVVCYTWITPFAEFRLIKAGKTAPALTFCGALLGFVLPLSSAIANSVSYFDMVIWAVLALIVQIGVFFMVRSGLAGLCQKITDDELAPAVLLATIAIATGLLNAACMTY